MISDRKDMATFEPTVLPAMQPTETIGIQIFLFSHKFFFCGVYNSQIVYFVDYFEVYGCGCNTCTMNMYFDYIY